MGKFAKIHIKWKETPPPPQQLLGNIINHCKLYTGRYAGAKIKISSHQTVIDFRKNLEDIPVPNGKTAMEAHSGKVKVVT